MIRESFSSYGSARSNSFRSIHTNREGREGRRSRRTSQAVPESSPAAEFLSSYSQYKKPSDPDEKGQTIGQDKKYVLGTELGRGGFGLVREAYSLSDGGRSEKYAVKIVRKILPDKDESENDKFQEQIEREISIWRLLSHENILSLKEAIFTDFATFSVMEFVPGGTLHDLVAKTNNTEYQGLKPDVARLYTHQLACALRYLHNDIQITHRDIKPENCLIDRPLENGGCLKLTDFGLADFTGSEEASSSSTVLAEDEDENAVLGTPEYLAPEVIKFGKRLDPAVDIWAFGASVHTMLMRRVPFKHELRSKQLDLVKAGKWDEDAMRQKLDGYDGVENVLELVKGCMTMDPQLRWNISNVLDCKWLSGIPSS
ncbi:hypothetical protein H2203_002032 [Taxawa tesnikishii (nom. ined.)]|nr:hypothetical protein H2203_002032 [Dothideales sp. JES 119]